MTVRPQLAVTYSLADNHPSEWARRREDQGWDCLSVTDHLVTDYRPPFPHLWVSAGAIAAVTSRATVATAFVNGEAAIGIAIVGNTKSSSVFNHRSLQGRQMS